MNNKEIDAFYTTIVDSIVDDVWKKYPKDEKSRLFIYDRIAESFAGLVRAFTKPEGKLDLPNEEVEESGIE